MIEQSIEQQRQARAVPVVSAPMWRELLVLAGVCAFVLFYGLASFGLVGADEPRYAQIAREMLERHDWVVPVLYDKPWLEKPVLYYWQAMLSYSVFGVSDWAARLPVACDAVAMIAAVYFFVRRFWRGVQLDAALITASMAAIIGFGRAASTDMPLAALFTIGMLAWIVWHDGGEAKFLAAFYVSMGLATLAKGPVAPFLAALLIVLFAALRRDWHVIRRTLWAPGILLYLAVALPWFVAVQLRVPEFFRTFVLEHNLARYGSNLYRHHQPIWYYIPVLLIGLLPWTVLAITGFVRGVRGVWRRRGEDHRGSDVILVLALWAVVPIIFFSFSGSKLPGYILPSVPAWALLAGSWLKAKLARSERGNPILLVAHAAVASTVLVAALLCQYFVYRLHPTRGAYAIAGLVAGGVFVLTSGLLLIRGLRMLRLVTLLPVVIGLAFVIKVAAPAVDAKESARPVAQEIQQLGRWGAPIAGWKIPRETEYGLAYYMNRPIPLYDRDEHPKGEHVLVAGSGTKVVMAPETKAYWIGSYKPQGLDFYWVVPSDTSGR